MTDQKLHIVHTEASGGWGGQEIRILSEATGHRDRGHTVELLCPREATIFEAAKKAGLKVTALPIGRKNLAGLLAMRQWLKNHPADIINTHSSTDSWLAALATRWLKNAPTIVRTRHISAPVSTNYPTRWLYTEATQHIVTTGQQLKKTLIKDNGFPAGMITSIPTGVDEKRFKPGDKSQARQQLELPDDKTIIGIMATIRTWKGHQYLLEAIASLKPENTLVLIVGEGPNRDNVEKTIRELQLTDQVIMPGNQQDVVPWLHAMDLFVLPSYANEGVPQALMQAMACELPVISTPIGSTEEIVIHEETGLIVQPKDSTALAEAIHRMLTSEDLARTLAKQGRQHILQGYTRETMLDNMEKVFCDAMNCC